MSPRSARTATLAALVLALTSATAQAATPSAYVYATSFDRLVSQYAADGSGMLWALTPPDATSDDASSGVAASPDGRSLYVVNQGSDSVSQYDVGVGGALTPKTPATVSTGAFPFGIAVAPDGAHVYVANQDGASVTVYDVGGDGGLTAASETPAGDGAMQIVLTADGEHAYVANLTAGTVSEYDVDDDGSLSSDGEVTTPAPAAIAVSPDGDSAYVANRSTSGRISQFSIEGDGTLSPKSPATVDAGATPVALTATSDSVYASNFADDTISQYTVDGDGELTPKPTPAVATGRNPWGLAIAPDGKSVYAAAFSDRAVRQYDVGAGGELVAKGTPAVASAFRPIAVAAVASHDGLAPTIDLRTPADGAQYDFGAVVTADYSCADEDGGSGLAACEGDVASGAALDTSTAGAHSFTVAARDAAGNTATVTHTYNVASPGNGPGAGYDFGGFLGSIQNGARVKAGDAVPIVFSLGGDVGIDVLAAGSPSSGRVDCEHPGTPTTTEPALSKGGRGLFFNARTGHYVFVWQTERSWKGTCRTFVLALNDGSVHQLTVNFRPKCRQATARRR
jgi:YVTN family beta-propeller protein